MECEHCGKKLKGFKVDLSDTRTVGSRVYLHSGNHPKLQQANKLIEEARELERELDEIRREQRKKLKPLYHREVTVHVKEDGGWSSKIPMGDEYITITSLLQNKGEYEDFMREFGSVMNPPDEKTYSVNYYRKHGILFNDGGGHCVLQDEQPCSDHEWNELKKGELPEKFTRR